MDCGCEKVDYGLVALCCCHRKWSAPIELASINSEAAIDTCFDECYNRIVAAVVCGDVNGRYSIVHSLLRVGTELDQRTDARLVAILRGDVAWRRSVVVRLIRICAEFDQGTDARLVAFRRGNVERRYSVMVPSMWILSNANQLLCDVPQYVTIATVHNRKDKMRIILVFQR